MKKDKSDIQSLELIEKFKKDLGGVFTTSDLYHITGHRNPVANQKAIKRFIKAGMLTRVKREIYVTKEFDLWKLASKIQPQGYISLHAVLAKNGLAGTLSYKRVDLVTTGPKKIIKFDNYLIRIFSISEKLFFGFKATNGGMNIANNEKAFIDLLYYHNRGYKFPIDPLQEIDTEKLNKKIILRYLKHYQNPKFIKFVRGVFRG